MKHYIDRITGEVLALEEDGSQDQYITETMKPISAKELEEMRRPDGAAEVLSKIEALESTVTARRMREAITTGDSSFIVGVDRQIQGLRDSLKGRA